MPDKLVEVAAFGSPVEAHAARGLLEVEGIRAVLGGEQTSNVFSGIPIARITLHVAEQDAERAVALLATAVGGEGSAPPDESRLWVCPLCGDAVNEDLAECPACGTEQPETWRSSLVTAVPSRKPDSQDIQEELPREPGRITADTPIEAVSAAREDALELPDADTFLGDDLVRRAYQSALFGLVFPILSFYAIWLLGRLALYPGKISPRMMPRLYAAIAMAAPLCIGCLLLLLYLGHLFLFQR